MSKMHDNDAHGDNLTPIETSNQIHIRAQFHAAKPWERCQL